MAELTTVDVRIMAHPIRAESAKNLQKQLRLPDDAICWDDRKNGGDCLYTARKTWNLPISDNCTHRIVLNDDVEPCNEFQTIAETVAKRFPHSIVSFFHAEMYGEDIRYVRTNKVWGCALMFPVELIKPCWKYIDAMIESNELPWEILRHDSGCFRRWAENEGIKIINTVPSLVQHIGDISLVGIDRHRVSTDYTKNPPTTGW